MSEATPTTNHDEVRRWAERRGGRPAIIRTAQGQGGILRFDFGDDDTQLEEVSWDEFFRVFDENQLALLRQEETVSGQPSRFFRFIDRNTSSGVNHDTEVQGVTGMMDEMDEAAAAPMIEEPIDKGVGRRQASREDRDGMGMDEMQGGMTGDMDEDQMDQGRSQRSTSRRPAAKRSSSKRTSARSSSGRSSRGGSRRASSASKSRSRKTASASRSSSRPGARKTAGRKAAAKKLAAKRSSGTRRSSASSSSRSRSAKRAPARRSR